MRRSPITLILLGLPLFAACTDKGNGGGGGGGSGNTSEGTGMTGDTDPGSATSASGASSDTSPTSGGTSTTSTSGTTDGSSDGSVTTNTTGSFVEQPDGGLGNECDPRLQDCMDGERCTAWANDGGTFWNENKCVEVTGNGVAGDTCMLEGGGVSGVDDCAKGFICMNADENSIGACVKFCTGEDSDCDPGFICAIYNDGVLPICLDECHPLLQDCPTAQACIDTPNGNFICFSDASGAGGLDGDPCPPEHGENSCDPGMWCGPGSAGCTDPKCCTAYCDVTAGTDPCPSPDQCISFYADPSNAPPMYQDVGVCVTP